MAFYRVRINLSASPFAFGQYRVTFRCLNPRYLANCSNSELLNGGPLSVFRTQGTLCREKIISSFGMTVLALVELIISTSRNRLNLSMTTSNSSPDKNGPTNSATTSFHGVSGSLDMIRGSGLVKVPIMFLICISEMTSYLQSVAILVLHLVVPNLCTNNLHKLC